MFSCRISQLKISASVFPSSSNTRYLPSVRPPRQTAMRCITTNPKRSQTKPVRRSPILQPASRPSHRHPTHPQPPTPKTKNQKPCRLRQPHLPLHNSLSPTLSKCGLSPNTTMSQPAMDADSALLIPGWSLTSVAGATLADGLEAFKRLPMLVWGHMSRRIRALAGMVIFV